MRDAIDTHHGLEDVLYRLRLLRDLHDPDFRPEAEERHQALLRLMPLSGWAKLEGPRRSTPEAAAQENDLHDLMEGLAVPPNVAGVTYASGCRIRRVRVPAARPAPRGRNAKTLIVSKRALDEVRAGNRR